MPEIDPDKTAHRLRSIDRLFLRRVRQVEPLLKKVDPQHPLHPDRWAVIAGLGIIGLDQHAQRRPRHHPLHLGEKCRPPRRPAIALKPRRRHAQLPHPPTLVHHLHPCTLYRFLTMWNGCSTRARTGDSARSTGSAISRGRFGQGLDDAALDRDAPGHLAVLVLRPPPRYSRHRRRLPPRGRAAPPPSG